MGKPRRRPNTMSTEWLNSGLIDTPGSAHYSTGGSAQRGISFGLGRKRVDFGAPDLLVGARGAGQHRRC